MITPAAQITRMIERLGYAGMVLFLFLALLLWLVRAPEQVAWLSIATMSYAACVATFLGALHWGAAFSIGETDNPASQAVQKRHIFWGVAPSLLSWFASLMPAYAGLPLMGLVFVACYLVDRQLYPLAWRHWLTLRFRLTIAAVISCLIGAAGI